MLRITDPQLENLMFLRDVTIPWMRENPGRVDFNHYESDCGTFRCVLGWYAKQRHGKSVIDTALEKGGPWWEYREFVGRDTWNGDLAPLFSGDIAGTLDDRSRYLDELIAQRLVALEAR